MESEPTSTVENRELTRVGAFSDGVFAIAIALLALNLEVPDVPGRDLGKAISALGDDLLAYGIGFAVIERFWIEHRSV